MWPLDQLFNYLYYIVHLLLARVPLVNFFHCDRTFKGES